MIDYSPLFQTMENKGITQYQLLKHKVVDNKTLDTIKKNGNLTLLTLERICVYLDCTLNDIVTFKE